jgi:hypothetical protein
MPKGIGEVLDGLMWLRSRQPLIRGVPKRGKIIVRW